MQIVIDIDEEVYEEYKGKTLDRWNHSQLAIYIANGIPLPKGHGRLIDADMLKENYPHDTDWEYPVNTNEYVCDTIDAMETIIEADKAESEDKGVLEKLAEKQNNLLATNKAWSDAIEKNGYVN